MSECIAMFFSNFPFFNCYHQSTEKDARSGFQFDVLELENENM